MMHETTWKYLMASLASELEETTVVVVFVVAVDWRRR